MLELCVFSYCCTHVVVGCSSTHNKLGLFIIIMFSNQINYIKVYVKLKRHAIRSTVHSAPRPLAAALAHCTRAVGRRPFPRGWCHGRAALHRGAAQPELVREAACLPCTTPAATRMLARPRDCATACACANGRNGAGLRSLLPRQSQSAQRRRRLRPPLPAGAVRLAAVGVAAAASGVCCRSQWRHPCHPSCT